MTALLGGRASGHPATHCFPGVDMHEGTRPVSARIPWADPVLADRANTNLRGRAESTWTTGVADALLVFADRVGQPLPDSVEGTPRPGCASSPRSRGLTLENQPI
jgi:hypothetical protein